MKLLFVPEFMCKLFPLFQSILFVWHVAFSQVLAVAVGLSLWCLGGQLLTGFIV